MQLIPVLALRIIGRRNSMQRNIAFDTTGNLHDRWASTPGGKRMIYGNTEKNTFITDSLPELIRIPRNSTQTLYARIGDSFSIVFGSISLIATIFPVLRRLTTLRK
jgi:hypothetical protein